MLEADAPRVRCPTRGVVVGKTKATLCSFFDALEAFGDGRCGQITYISADGADWIGDVVAEDCPAAVRAADPFHVVSWATDALDEVRREAWNDARKLARSEPKRGRGRPRKNAPPGQTGLDRQNRPKTPPRVFVERSTPRDLPDEPGRGHRSVRRLD